MEVGFCAKYLRIFGTATISKILLLRKIDKLEDLQITVTHKMPVIIYLYAYAPFPVILTTLTYYLNILNLLNTFL